MFHLFAEMHDAHIRGVDVWTSSRSVAILALMRQNVAEGNFLIRFQIVDSIWDNDGAEDMEIKVKSYLGRKTKEAERPPVVCPPKLLFLVL